MSNYELALAIIKESTLTGIYEFLKKQLEEDSFSYDEAAHLIIEAQNHNRVSFKEYSLLCSSLIASMAYDKVTSK